MSETSNPYELPIVPIKGSVLFPHVAIPVSFGRASSVAAIDAALASDDKMIAVLAQRDAAVEEPQLSDLFSIGTAALVKLIGRFDSKIQVILYGLQRVRVLEPLQSQPYLKARLQPDRVLAEEGVEAEALQREIIRS